MPFFSLSYSRKIFIVVFAVACLSAGCHYLHTGPKQDITYVPLGDYNYTAAKVDSGTTLRIIAFSGGKDSDKDTIYYSQFITINRLNGDTVRVLSSLIRYDDPNGETTNSYTMPSMYNGQKGITDATFMPPDSLLAIMLNTPLDAEHEKHDTGTAVFNDPRKSGRPQLVAINNSLPLLQTPSYKTIVGVLYFKQIPW